jgi:hypothetical protein
MIVSSQGLLGRSSGMTYCPCRAHDPGVSSPDPGGVGKTGHHAVALDQGGERPHDAAACATPG